MTPVKRDPQTILFLSLFFFSASFLIKWIWAFLLYYVGEKEILTSIRLNRMKNKCLLANILFTNTAEIFLRISSFSNKKSDGNNYVRIASQRSRLSKLIFVMSVKLHPWLHLMTNGLLTFFISSSGYLFWNGIDFFTFYFSAMMRFFKLNKSMKNNHNFNHSIL